MWLKRQGPSFSHFSLRVRRRVDRILRQSRESRRRGIIRSRDPGTQNPPWYTRPPAELRKARQLRLTRNQVDMLSQSKTSSDVSRALDSARRAGVIDARNLRDLVVEKCSELDCMERCQPMLELWLRRNTFSWTVYLAANARCGHLDQALQVFKEMSLEGVKPSSFALCVVVEAFGETGDAAILEIVHGAVEAGECSVKERFWDRLVEAYAKVGLVDAAKRVFEKMEVKIVENWNALITAYARGGDTFRALEVLKRMDVEGACPNRETFYQVFLSFQGRIEFLEAGRIIYRESCSAGFKSDVRIVCALVQMFSRCGSLRDARMVFENAGFMDSTCCTAMIVEYVAHGVYESALSLFRRLLTNAEKTNTKIDSSAFSAAIDACTAMADFPQAKKLHEQLVEKDLIKLDGLTTTKTALVIMYGSCGDIAKAAEVFKAQEISIREESSWNALMGAYARAGQVKPVLQLLRAMDWYGMAPDGRTMLNVLVALTQSGLVKKCREYFRSIAADRQLQHTSEHYECVVDILARKGFVKQAKELIECMPFEPRPIMWKVFAQAPR